MAWREEHFYPKVIKNYEWKLNWQQQESVIYFSDKSYILIKVHYLFSQQIKERTGAFEVRLEFCAAAPGLLGEKPLKMQSDSSRNVVALVERRRGPRSCIVRVSESRAGLACLARPSDSQSLGAAADEINFGRFNYHCATPHCAWFNAKNNSSSPSSCLLRSRELSG